MCEFERQLQRKSVDKTIPTIEILPGTEIQRNRLPFGAVPPGVAGLHALRALGGKCRLLRGWGWGRQGHSGLLRGEVGSSRRVTPGFLK